MQSTTCCADVSWGPEQTLFTSPYPENEQRQAVTSQSGIIFLEQFIYVCGSQI